MGRAYHLCQQCKGTGIISRPYMVGMKSGDLHTMTVCPCTKEPIENPKEGKSHE